MGSRDFTPSESLYLLDRRADLPHDATPLERALVKAYHDQQDENRSLRKRLSSLERDSERTEDKLSDTGRMLVTTAVDNARFWRERAIYIVVAVVVAVVAFVLGKGGR